MNESPVILIVDDTPENLRVLGSLLEGEGYEVRVATSGELALKSARQAPPDLILLDVMMPVMDGYQVCRQLKATPALAEVPVIFISAVDGSDQKVNAFEEGAVDYITKPFYAAEVLARVKTNVENKFYRESLQSLVRARTRELALTKEATIASMAILAEHRDNDTGAHIQRTKHMVKLLAAVANKSLKVPLDEEQLDLLFQSAPLHDIGKVGIGDDILLKAGALTEGEFSVMKMHTLIGAEVIRSTIKILGTNTFLDCALDLTEFHHERWDGTGYPHGLRGDAIPYSARLMTIADVYDALRSRRPYKEPRTHEETIRIMTDGDGRTSPDHFEPTLLKAFLSIQPEIQKVSQKFSE